MRKRVFYSLDFFTCKLHTLYVHLGSLCILREKVKALKFNKGIKNYKRVIRNVALIFSLNSLDYDGTNDFSFLKRNYTRSIHKYTKVLWLGKTIQLKLIIRLCWANILDGGSRDPQDDSSLFWPVSEIYPRPIQMQRKTLFCVFTSCDTLHTTT